MTAIRQQSFYLVYFLAGPHPRSTFDGLRSTLSNVEGSLPSLTLRILIRGSWAAFRHSAGPRYESQMEREGSAERTPLPQRESFRAC